VVPPVTGLPFVDSFLCFIIPFYQRVVMTPEGRFIAFLNLGTSLIFMYFCLIESGRQGVTGISRFPAFFGLLGHLLGLGAVSNIFFVPALLNSDFNVAAHLSKLAMTTSQHLSKSATTSQDQQQQQQTFTTSSSSSSSSSSGLFGISPSPSGIVTIPEWWRFRGATLSHVRLSLLLISCLCVVVSALLNTHPMSPAFVYLTCVFQFFPLTFLLPTLVAAPPPSLGTTLTPAHASRLTCAGYLLLAGFCAATYYEYLFELLAQPGGVLAPVAPVGFATWVLAIPGGIGKVMIFTEPAVRFMILDLVGVMLTPVLIMAAEGMDVVQGLGLLLLSVMISPGAAVACYLAKREEKVTGLGEYFTGKIKTG